MASGRIARWSMIMSEYDYTIQYIKGSSNVVADQLSRLLEIPDDDWINMEPDDETQHPFLHLWPDLLQISRMLPYIDIGRTSDEPRDWGDIELQLNIGGDKPHEQLFFSQYATRQSYKLDDSVITFSSERYQECSDFSIVYGMLLKRDRHSFSDHSDTANSPDPNELTQVQSTDKPKATPAPIQWTAVEKRHLSLYNQCFLQNGYLYKVVQGKELLCVPDHIVDNVSIRFDIIQQFHDPPWSGHRGVQYTYQALRRRFHWPKLRADVEKFISSCQVCQANKKNRQKPQGLMQPLQIPETICISYNVDFMTDLPPSTEQKFDMVMVVVDRHSGRLFAIPTWKRATGTICCEHFHDEICARAGRGVPREIISDRDIRFTKGFWKKWQTRLGISLRFTSARTQHSNGGAERAIATFEELLLSYINYD